MQLRGALLFMEMLLPQIFATGLLHDQGSGSWTSPDVTSSLEKTRTCLKIPFHITHRASDPAPLTVFFCIEGISAQQAYSVIASLAKQSFKLIINWLEIASSRRPSQ
jgi:hypothetical protein